ncbi:TlpA family protein disulfide reductase [Neptunicella sp.]|uniref:TlpA family protein disulfide reductase n=1 Tax=Neptunicella sp. TaxID=2125986 RepID=UPI003F690EA7
MKHVFFSFLLVVLFTPAQASEFDIQQAQIRLMDASPQTLADYADGKPLYLKFWASWCQPCMQQMPHFQHVQEQYGDQIQVVAVDIDINETRNDIQHVVKQFGLTMPIALDSDHSLAQSLNFVGTPYHILINKQGRVVHSGHEADAKLDRKIQLLAAGSASQLPPILLTDKDGHNSTISLDSEQPTLLFFSATWCDWYLQKTRPAMSQACIVGQQNINQLFAEYPKLNLRGVVNNIWTETKDLNNYIDKYHIQHPISLDDSGDLFFSFGITQIPQLIVIKQGKELLRIKELTDLQHVKQQLAAYLP